MTQSLTIRSSRIDLRITIEFSKRGVLTVDYKGVERL